VQTDDALVADAKHRVLEARMRAKLADFPFASLPRAAVDAGWFNDAPTPEQWQQLEFDDAGDVLLESLARAGCMRKVDIDPPGEPSPGFAWQGNRIRCPQPDDTYWWEEWRREVTMAFEVCESVRCSEMGASSL
jgi:hypothetical protein